MARGSLLLVVGIRLALAFGPRPAHVTAAAREINVAAAADLSTALPEIAHAFGTTNGIEVKLSFAASGAITQQIENGAPFDVFLSADMGYPQQLVAEHKADAATLRHYATGQLVLWTQSESPLDLDRVGMNVLLDRTVKKIAIANPQHAPYGRAAVAALKHYGLYDKVRDRLVIGENVTQAAQFVESGNAQVGLVALAHALAPAVKAKGKYWKVPGDAYPPLAQGAVVTAQSAHPAEAADFVKYLNSPGAVAVFEHYGFSASAQK